MQKKLVIVCLINFLIATFMGLTLRYVFALPFHEFLPPAPVEYRNLMHAHSHSAMLGWVYLMLYVLIVHYFIPEKKPIFIRLFWLTEIAVVGMMLSFPIEGYGVFSISFSTLHIISSYIFIRLVWKNLEVKSKPIRHLLKASLIFMFVSTMGIWGVGPAAALYGVNSAFFQLTLQFFLHFQFNGWFLFAVLAIFLNRFAIPDNVVFNRFYNMLIVGTVLTYALPVSWFAYHPSTLWINGIGVLAQLGSGYYFIKIVRPFWSDFWSKTCALAKWMYGLALLSFVLKIVLQTASILPEVARMAFQYHNFVIGFIHLMMLGVISGFLLAFLLESSLMRLNQKTAHFGVSSFMIGFVATELILLLQGLFYYTGYGMIPNYYLLLFLFSILLPLGIFVILLNILNHETKTYKTT